MNRKVGTIVTIGFTLTLALLIVSAGLSYHNTRELVEADLLMDHTHRVIGLLEAVLSTLKDAETGQRGFIITQEEPYLQPYTEAVVRVHDELRRLKTLTSDNPGQQERQALLEQKVNVKLDELDRTIAALKRTKDFKAVQEDIRIGKGKQEMDAVRKVVAEMQQVERDLLQHREEESVRSYRTAVLSNLLTGILAVALVSLVFYLVRRYDALRQRAAERTEHLAVLGKLLAGVAHEVRNPLAGIRSTMQLWQRLPEEAQTPESMEAVVHAVDRLDDIVGRLLYFARADTIVRQPVSINDLVVETLNLLGAQAAGQKVTWERELQADLPPVLGSANGLRQVFLNLVANALQAMPDGGRLRCLTRSIKGGQQVLVRFADTGPGIASDDQRHLFEPFFTTRPAGTGLGLALCREIVLQHGGQIHLERTEGIGATFCVTLPAAR